MRPLDEANRVCIADDRAEQVGSLPQFVVVAPPEATAAGVARVPDDLVQSFGVSYCEWPQHVRVEHGERDGQQADANGKRQHCRQHERRTLAHVARGVAGILQQLLEPHPPARFEELLVGDRHVAKGAPRGGASLIGTHAFSDEAIGFEVEVGLNFVGKVVDGAPSPEGHQDVASSGPSTRAMAAASRRQRLV